MTDAPPVHRAHCSCGCPWSAANTTDYQAGCRAGLQAALATVMAECGAWLADEGPHKFYLEKAIRQIAAADALAAPAGEP